MSAWFHELQELAEIWASGLWRATWQGGIAIALVWLVCLAWPRMPVRAQCWLWRLAYLRMFIALFWATPLDLAPSLRELWFGISFLPNRVALSVAVGLSLLWVLGVSWCARRVCREWRAARKLRAECQPLEHEQIEDCCVELCERSGLKRVPALVVCANGSPPFLTGVRLPTVCLPVTMVRDFDLAQVRLVLACELANLKQRSLLWAWLPAAAQTIFFFHPLVWLANRQCRAAQEAACDEVALEIARVPASEYAGLLVRVAEERMHTWVAHNGETNGAACSFGTLKERLTRMKGRTLRSPKAVSVVCDETLST